MAELLKSNLKILNLYHIKNRKSLILNKKHMALEITDANFDEIVLKSDKPVLIDLWAEWCGPCRQVGPVVEELAKEYEGKALVGKLNVDHNPNVSMKFGVRSIPTLLFFKGGQMVDR